MPDAPEIPHSAAREISDILTVCSQLDPESSHQLAQTALNSDPTKWELWLASADTLRALQRFKDAESACKRAQQLAPERGEVWFSTGSLLAERGRIDDACDAYDKALAAYEKSVGNQAGQDMDDSEEQYIDAIQELSMALAAKADVLREAGRLDEALKDIDMALAGFDNFILLMAKAWITSHMDDHAATIQTIETIHKLYPEQPIMAPLLAYHLTASGCIKRAAEELARVKSAGTVGPSWSNSMITNLYHARDYRGALGHVQAALMEDPTDPETWYLKALVTMASGGDTEEVVDALVTAVSIGPDLAGRMLQEEALRTLASEPRLARLMDAADGQRRSNWQVEGAKRRMARWRAEYSVLSHYQYRVGAISSRIMRPMSKTNSGLREGSYWSKWIKESTISSNMIFELCKACMFYSGGRMGDAASVMKSFIKSSNIPGELVICGHILAYMGRYDEALEAFDKATDEDPRNEEALRSKFRVFMDINDDRRSREVTRQMRMEIPESAAALMAESTLLIMDERYDEAVDILVGLCLVDPWDLTSYITLADLLVADYRSDEAVRVLDDMLEKDERRDDAWVTRATALYDMGKFEEMVGNAKRGLEINPKNSEGWYQTARGLSSMGDKGAFDALLVSIQMEPRNIQRAMMDNSLDAAKRHPRFDDMIKSKIAEIGRVPGMW